MSRNEFALNGSYQKPALGGFFDFWSVSLAKNDVYGARIVPPQAAIVPEPGILLNWVFGKGGFLRVSRCTTMQRAPP